MHRPLHTSRGHALLALPGAAPSRSTHASAGPSQTSCWGGRGARTARIVPAASDAADAVRGGVAQRGVAAPGDAVGARQLAGALRLIEQPAVAQQRAVVVPCGRALPPQPALRLASGSSLHWPLSACSAKRALACLLSAVGGADSPSKLHRPCSCSALYRVSVEPIDAITCY